MQSIFRLFSTTQTVTCIPPSRPQGKIPDVFRMHPLHDIELFEVSVEELQAYLANGSFTSVDYVKFCLERIQQVWLSPL